MRALAPRESAARSARGDVHLHAGAGEGEERLQHPVLEIRRGAARGPRGSAPRARPDAAAAAASACSSGSTSWDARPTRRRARRVKSNGSVDPLARELVEDRRGCRCGGCASRLPSRSYQSSRPRFSSRVAASTARTSQSFSVKAKSTEVFCVGGSRSSRTTFSAGRPSRIASPTTRPVAVRVEPREQEVEAARRPGVMSRERRALVELEGVERGNAWSSISFGARRPPASRAHGEVDLGEDRMRARCRARRSSGGTAAAERLSASGVESCLQISSDARPSRRAAPAAGRPASRPAGTGSGSPPRSSRRRLVGAVLRVGEGRVVGGAARGSSRRSRRRIPRARPSGFRSAPSTAAQPIRSGTCRPP